MVALGWLLTPLGLFPLQHLHLQLASYQNCASTWAMRQGADVMMTVTR
jgi:hypothetical protein